MAEFLTTNSISHKIDKILKNAEEFVVIVSPYYQISRNFLDRLIDAGNRNVKIELVYGKQELFKDKLNDFLKVKNLDIFYLG